MLSLLTLLGLAVLLFISTNIDDLFILVSMFASSKYKTKDIVIGQYVGMTVLFGASLFGVVLSFPIPKQYASLLGLFPIAVGLFGLLQVLRATDVKSVGGNPVCPITKGGSFASVVIITIASGADNIAAYVPSLTLRSRWDIFGIGAVFIVLTGTWCCLAHWIARHATLAPALQRQGLWVAPLMLISVGVMDLLQVGTLHYGH